MPQMRRGMRSFNRMHKSTQAQNLCQILRAFDLAPQGNEAETKNPSSPETRWVCYEGRTSVFNRNPDSGPCAAFPHPWALCSLKRWVDRYSMNFAPQRLQCQQV